MALYVVGFLKQHHAICISQESGNYILNSTVVSCYFKMLLYHSIPSIGACFLWQIWIFCFPLFVEREENVKADIFAAYITLLRQTRPVASQTLDADAMEDDSG